MQIKSDSVAQSPCSNDIQAMEQQQTKSHHRINLIQFNLHNYEQDEEFLADIISLNILSLPFSAVAVLGGIKGRLLVPLVYTAGDHDLRVQLQATTRTNSSSPGGQQSSNQLRISSVIPASENSGYTAEQRAVVATLYIYPDPFSNVTQIVIPCHHLVYGGTYELEVLQDDVEQSDERLKQQLDVR